MTHDTQDTYGPAGAAAWSPAAHARSHRLPGSDAYDPVLRAQLSGKAAVAYFRVHFPDLVDRISSLNAQGWSLEDIRRRISIMMHEDIAPELIANILAKAEQEATEWQTRPLEQFYPIVTIERLRMKWRDDDELQSGVCYFAIGFQSKGPKEVLGFWVNTPLEDLWQVVTADLARRGVSDALYIFASDGEIKKTESPPFESTILMPHFADYVRQSADLVSMKDRSSVKKALREVYCARNEVDARKRLLAFEESPLGRANRAVAQIWNRNWNVLAPAFEVAPEVRRVVGSTHAVDLLRLKYRRAVGSGGHLRSSAEITHVMYALAGETLHKWKRPQREWQAAKAQLSLAFAGRFVV